MLFNVKNVRGFVDLPTTATATATVAVTVEATATIAPAAIATATVTVVAAPAAIATATVTATAAKLGAFLARTRFVDRQLAAVQVLSIQPLDSRLRFRFLRHFHKAKATRVTAQLVLDHNGRSDLTKIGKRRQQFVVRGIVRQVTDIDIHAINLLLFAPCTGAYEAIGLNKRKRAGLLSGSAMTNEWLHKRQARA
jgi:hypothetical protein